MGLTTEEKIAFDFPVTVDGVVYDHLVMRRPKMKDALAADKTKAGSEVEKTFILMARLCTFNGQDIAPNVIEELYNSDFNKLGKQFEVFQEG